MFAIRRLGYRVIDRLSEVKQVRNSTGFGLYDKAFVSVLRRLPDPYPYFSGIVAELGFRYATVPYTPAEADQRRHQEQPVSALRHRRPGHRQSLEDSAAAGDDRRLLQLGRQPDCRAASTS